MRARLQSRPAVRRRGSSPRRRSDRVESLAARQRVAAGCATTMDHPFRSGWSIRPGPLRLRSLLWYWQCLTERLSARLAQWRRSAPAPAHHAHYCERCDRSWLHEGDMCARPWAAPCGRADAAHRAERPGPDRRGRDGQDRDSGGMGRGAE